MEKCLHCSSCSAYEYDIYVYYMKPVSLQTQILVSVLLLLNFLDYLRNGIGVRSNIACFFLYPSKAYDSNWFIFPAYSMNKNFFSHLAVTLVDIQKFHLFYIFSQKLNISFFIPYMWTVDRGSDMLLVVVVVIYFLS